MDLQTYQNPAEPPVTEILNQWRAGSSTAGNRLVPLVYRQLRAIAANHLRRERQGHTLQATALVHEAFLRLGGQRQIRWQNRLQFMAVSARLMRQILVDHARMRGRKKRGGNAQRVPFERLANTLTDYVETYPGLLALDDALHDLVRWDAEKALVVELRYFGGLTTHEIASLTGVSITTVERRWRGARAWLYRHLTTSAS